MTWYWHDSLAWSDSGVLPIPLKQIIFSSFSFPRKVSQLQPRYATMTARRERMTLHFPPMSSPFLFSLNVTISFCKSWKWNLTLHSYCDPFICMCQIILCGWLHGEEDQEMSISLPFTCCLLLVLLSSGLMLCMWVSAPMSESEKEKKGRTSISLLKHLKMSNK